MIDKKKIIPKWKVLLLASRPKTLPAAFAPVFVGSSIAINENSFKFLNAFIALVCSILIQVGTNYVNDLYDFLAGTDTKERIGPMRALASGLITVREMKMAIYFTFSVVFFLGLYLVYDSSYWILLVGILSILAGIAYTAGPYPLAYHALGDLFVFLFFGLVGTMGSYYIQSNNLNWLSLFSAIPVGLLITNILVINNYRDIDEDKLNNKITLAVKIGRTASKIQYIISIFISYASLLVIYFYLLKKYSVLMPFVLIPVAIVLIKMVLTTQGKKLNKTLALTAGFSAMFSLLLAIGIAI